MANNSLIWSLGHLHELSFSLVGSPCGSLTYMLHQHSTLQVYARNNSSFDVASTNTHNIDIRNAYISNLAGLAEALPLHLDHRLGGLVAPGVSGLGGTGGKHIYIYIYICICTYIYIYIYTHVTICSHNKHDKTIILIIVIILIILIMIVISIMMLLSSLALTILSSYHCQGSLPKDRRRESWT